MVAARRRCAAARCRGIALAALSCIALASCGVAAAQPPGGAPPGDAVTAELDGHVLGGWRAFEAARFADALRHFSRAAQLAPARADVQVGLAEALFWLGEHRRALDHFERAIQLAPNLARAHAGAGHALLNLSAVAWQEPRTRLALLGRAEASFTRALELDPNQRAARDGLRFVADSRKPAGKPLVLLELPILLLLLALTAALLLRLRRHGLPRPREYLWPLGLFAGTRLLLFAAFAAAPALLPESPLHPYPVLRDPDNFVLDTVAGRWDSNLYADVSVRGYNLPVPGQPSAWGTVGQFPLLPVLHRWLAHVLDDARVAALLIPNAALLLASLLLYDLFRAEHGARLAAGAVCAMLVLPASLHGSVLYAESLLLLGLAGLARNLQRGAPVQAALWGVFAGLSRINALAIIPYLLLQWWQGGGLRARSWGSLVACCSPALGLVLFMLYLQVELGDAFAYFKEVRVRRFGDGPFLMALSEAWHVVSHLATMAPGHARGGPLPTLLLALSCLVIYAAALVGLVRKRAFGPALFVAAGILLAVTSNLSGAPRYLWPLFPVALWLASTCDRRIVRWAAPLASLAGLLIAAVAYARWYFVP